MEKDIVVLDCGAGSLKVGLASDEQPRLVCPNLSFKSKGETRSFTGDALVTRDEILSLTLRRPFDRGYLVNPDLQREIITRVFNSVLEINPEQCGLVITEPPFNFESCRAELLKIVFDLGFVSVVVVSCAELALLHSKMLEPESLSHRALTGVVVDAGFSFCHVTPICAGKIMTGSIRRIDFGGKAMTNYFKELISFRSLHLMDETYLVETIKESLCFVSQNPKADLELSKKKGWASPFYREFVLPDGVTNLKGCVRDRPKTNPSEIEAIDKEQFVTVNNERFMVPEVLFRPSDIGLNQAGLPETICQAVESAPSFFRPLLYANIIPIGGLVQCPGWIDRLSEALRSLVDIKKEVKVIRVSDPVSFAWKGGSILGNSPLYKSRRFSRKQYHNPRIN